MIADGRKPNPFRKPDESVCLLNGCFLNIRVGRWVRVHISIKPDIRFKLIHTMGQLADGIDLPTGNLGKSAAQLLFIILIQCKGLKHEYDHPSFP